MVLVFYYVLLNVIFFSLITCANIGLIFNVPSLSNHFMYRPITKGLAERGHKITLMTTNPTAEEKNNENITIIDVGDVSYKVWKKYMSAMGTANGTKGYTALTKFRKLWIEMSHSISESQLVLPEAFEFVNGKKHCIDVVVGSLVLLTNFAFAKNLKAPFISIHPSDASFSFHYVFGNSFNPYYYTNTFFLEFRHPFSLQGIHDLKNLILERIYVMDGYKRTTDLMMKYFGKKYDDNDQYKMAEATGVSLFTVSQVWSVHKPVQPMTQFIGYVNSKAEQVIDKELQDWLDQSTEGVVLFSLGSNIQCASLPEEKVQMLKNTFSELPYKILFKWDGPSIGFSTNTRAYKWFSQRSVLAHPNIKAFVTHGGLLSISEAINNTVPLIAIPFFGDQEFNSQRVIDFGIGKRLFFNNLSSTVLRGAILEIATNITYRSNLELLSKKLFDTPFDPVTDAIWWIEHVIRHKDTSHLRADKISMAEYLLLDVIAYLFVMILVVISFLGLIKSLICKKAA